MPLTGCTSSSSMALTGRVASPSRRSKKVTFAVLLVTLLLLPLACFAHTNAAHAATTRKLVASFGASASKSPDPAPLANPQGLAVDQTSTDVYVADTANHRVEKFSAEGVFLLTFGRDVNKTKSGGLATQAEKDLCTAIEECQAGESGSAPGAFTTVQFLAVDPVSGAVYVGDTGDNLVSKFSSAGVLEGSWGVKGQLDGSTTTAKSFAFLAGVAVGATGTLHVMGVEHLANNVMVTKVFKFASAGEFLEEAIDSDPEIGHASSEARGVAVDGAGDLFSVIEDGSVYEATSAGEPGGRVSVGSSAAASAFGLEPVSGDLYVVTLDERITHYVFNGSGQVVEPGGGEPCTPGGEGCGASDSARIGFAGSGVAVVSAAGDTGNVYVSDPATGRVDVFELVTIPDVTTEPASEVGATSVRLNGKVKPDEIPLTECVFEYVPQQQFEEEEGAFTGVTPAERAACVAPDAEEVPTTGETEVHADVTGLTAGTTYDYRLVATNEHDLGEVREPGANVEFSTPPAPSVDSATVSGLSANSATLNTRVNPNGFQTTYQFQWGTGTEYGSLAPAEPKAIGSGSSDVLESQRIEGLEANVTYHWRVLATSVNGTTASTDHTFIYPTTGSGLPDGRSYEMVTPNQKNGALIGDVSLSSIGGVRVSPAGTSVAASSIQCFADAPACNGETNSVIGSSYRFTRTPSGWVTHSLALPATGFAGSAQFGPPNVQTGSALFASPGEPSGEEDLYLRSGGGVPAHLGPITPPADGPLGLTNSGAGGDLAHAESVDLSHVAWEEDAVGYWPFDETHASDASVYEYAPLGGQYPEHPLLVGVGENEQGQGSHSLISTCGTFLGTGGAPPGMMSADGRVVYFTAVGKGGCVGSGANHETPVQANALYARVDGEQADAHTVAVSARSPTDCTEACLSSPARDAEFVAASGDGSRVFFESTQQLTDQASQDTNGNDTAAKRECNSTTGVGGCNLYLYDLGAPAGRGLVDVSAGDSSGGGPRVRGVVAASEDGSHVYFVAQGVLTTAPNTQGQHASNGANNLYVYERDGAFPAGRVAFIASLPVSDQNEWVIIGDPGNVTPDGRFLVFVSHGDLTADDTSVSGAQQVFRYDAQTGQLLRISAGEEGFNDNGNRSTSTPCTPSECSENAKIPLVLGGQGRQDPAMSDDGSYVFFQSPVALTTGAPDDVRIGINELTGAPIYAQNVYEWHEGHVHLISDGRDLTENLGPPTTSCTYSAVCLLGSDASGHDVFFATADQLAGTDTNTELDIYDARVCEPASPCIPEPPAPAQPCSGEECHGTPAATPGVPTAPSATFNGAGNAKPTPLVTKTVTKKPVKCKKHFTKNRKGKCVRAKSRKKGKKN